MAASVVEATSTTTPVSPSTIIPAAAVSTGSDESPALTAADDG